MHKDPMEMAIEELDVVYGKPKRSVSVITHVLECIQSNNTDRFTFEVITEDLKRLELQFTQSALQTLTNLVGDNLNKERPKAN